MLVKRGRTVQGLEYLAVYTFLYSLDELLLKRLSRRTYVTLLGSPSCFPALVLCRASLRAFDVHWEMEASQQPLPLRLRYHPYVDAAATGTATALTKLSQPLCAPLLCAGTRRIGAEYVGLTITFCCVMFTYGRNELHIRLGVSQNTGRLLPLSFMIIVKFAPD